MANRKQYYAWVIAVIGFLSIFVSIGVTSTSFSAVSAYLYEYWGISNTVSATITNCRTISSIIAMAFCTTLHSRITYRWGISVSLLFGTFGWAFFMVAKGSVLLACVGSVCLGICRGLAGFVPVFAVFNLWFKKQKALVIGLGSAASGVATAVMPRILQPVVAATSLEFYFGFVMVFFTVIAVIVALFLRDRPEQMGFERWGEHEDVIEKEKEKPVAKIHEYSAGKREIILVYAAAVLVGFTHSVFGSVNTLSFTTAGWEAATAAAILSYYGIFNMICKVIYGWLSDRVSQTKMIVITFGTAAVGSLMLSFVVHPSFTFGMGVMTFLIWAMSTPASSTSFGVYAVDMTDSPERYAKLVQWQYTIYNIGGIIFSQMVGVLADYTGNYVLYDQMCVVANILAAAILLVAYRSAHKNWLRKQTQTAGNMEAAL